MLVLSRKEGQWIEIRHRSGDVLRIRFYNIQEGLPPRLNVAFDDDPRHFKVHRPERKAAIERWWGIGLPTTPVVPADAVTDSPVDVPEKASTS